MAGKPGIEDGGRCLMDEINALFAPPGRGDAKSRANAAKQAELHPYFKRPGKHKFGTFKILREIKFEECNNF